MIWTLVLSAALARDPWGPAAEEELPPEGSTEALTEDREAPELGTPPDETTAGEALLWVPRVVLAPAYAVERYLLYPPIRAVSIWAERNRVLVRVVDTFTLVDTRYRVRLYPTTLIDFGFRPSVGLFFGVKGNDAPYSNTSLQAAYGGDDWVAVKLAQRVTLSDAPTDNEDGLGSTELTLSAHYIDRPDHIFVVQDATASDGRTRFSRQQVGGALALDIAAPRYLVVELEGGGEQNTFGTGANLFDDPSTDAVIETGDVSGFGGYTLLHGAIEAALDSRGARPLHGSGGRLDLASTLATDLETGGSMTAASAEASGFLDLSGRDHTLGISQFVAMTSGQVPFTEQVTLGGGEHMRGFLEGYFRGGGALVSTLQYNWPVWVFTDATLFAELGGAFPDLATIDSSNLAASAGTGLRTSGRRDTSFQAIVAVGSAPLDQDFAVDSVRVVLGTNRGF